MAQACFLFHHPCWEQRAEGKGLHMADHLGDCLRTQSPLFPPTPSRLGGIFNADVVFSASARRRMSLQSHCCSPVHTQKGQVPTHSAKFAICFTASTAPGSGSSSMKKFLDSQMLMAFSCEGKESCYCTGLLATLFLARASSPPFPRTEDGDSEKGGRAGSGPLLQTRLASVGAFVSHLPTCTRPIQFRSEMLWSRLGFACAAPDTEGAARSFKANHMRLPRTEPNPRSASGGAFPRGSG